MLADDPRYYFDTTGTGNTVNTRHPRVVQMVMDSLRYWVEECHVDGFRFDLAVSLTRDRDAVDFNSPFLDAVTQDPVLAKVKMISESWDLGKWGYQVGNFPPGWAEWNGRFRDHVRAYVKGDDSTVDDFARNFLGSGDIFDRRGRRPWASINFITAHDGFTLADLYAYNEKHNEANGEDNRDGHDDNRSWNCGVEGPTDDPAILALRDRMRRFAMTALVVSQGVPMLLMGDENGRTQQRQQQRLLPGQRARLDGLEPRAARGRRSSPSSPARCACAASCALLAAPQLDPRRGGRRGRPARACAGCGPTATPMRQAGLDQRPGQGARHPARRRRGRRGAGARRTPRSSTSSSCSPIRPATTGLAAAARQRQRRDRPRDAAGGAPAPSWRCRRAACGSIRGSACRGEPLGSATGGRAR